MPKILLTDVFLRTLPAQLKLTEYWDVRVAGLCLRQSPRNHLTWCFRYRPKGDQALKRLTLGSYPEVSLALARLRAQAIRVEVSSGQDPAKDLSQEKARKKLVDLTFEALAEDYLERYAKVHKTSWRQDALFLKVHVYPVWRARPAQSLTRKDAAELLDAIAAASPSSANRTQSILSKLFNWSVDSGLLTSNPIAFMKKRAAERPRERILS
ncbi:MAG: integrase arm-type DNA-binding domain-containing protein, partial [Methylocystis sp.]